MQNITNLHQNERQGQLAKKSSRKTQQPTMTQNQGDAKPLVKKLKNSSQKFATITQNENRAPSQTGNKPIIKEDFIINSKCHRDPQSQSQCQQFRENESSYAQKIMGAKVIKIKNTVDIENMIPNEYYSHSQQFNYGIADTRLRDNCQSISNQHHAHQNNIHGHYQKLSQVVDSPKQALKEKSMRSLKEQSSEFQKQKLSLLTSLNKGTLLQLNQQQENRNFKVIGKTGSHNDNYNSQQSQQKSHQIYSSISSVNQGVQSNIKQSNQIKQNVGGTSKKPKAHKKSQSLFDQKISNIIAGLQQSIGPLDNNEKGKINNQSQIQFATTQCRQQEIINSTLFDQRIQKLTSESNKNIENNIKRNIQSSICEKNEDLNNLKKKKTSRKTSETKISNKLNQHGINDDIKVAEEKSKKYQESYQFSDRSNRGSIDFKQNLKTKPMAVHQRTKSDIQRSRKSNYGSHCENIANNSIGNQLSNSQACNDKERTKHEKIQRNDHQYSTITCSQTYIDNINDKKGTDSNLNQKLGPRLQVKSAFSESVHHLKNNDIRSKGFTLNSLDFDKDYVTIQNKKINPVQNAENHQLFNEKQNLSSNCKMSSTHDFDQNIQKNKQRMSLNLQNKKHLGRLSEAKINKQINKENKNLLINNISQIENFKSLQPEPRLKSAASSPSLNAHQYQNNIVSEYALPQNKKKSLYLKQQLNFCNPGIKLETDFSSANQKISQNLEKIDFAVQSIKSHRRSTSDGTSMTKIKSFKNSKQSNYQNIIKKDSNINNQKQPITYQNISQKPTVGNSIKTPRQFNLNYLPYQQKNQQQAQNSTSCVKNNSKIKIVSNLTSKRNSKEEELNYNSPRLFTYNQKLIMPTKDMYMEMKNFLTQFTSKTNTEQAKDQQKLASVKSSQHSILSSVLSNSIKDSSQQQNFAPNKFIVQDDGKLYSSKLIKQNQKVKQTSSGQNQQIIEESNILAAKHKRAYSDVFEHVPNLQKQKQSSFYKNQIVPSLNAQVEAQKIFIPASKQQIPHQETKIISLNLKKQKNQFSNKQVAIKSARQSPRNLQLIYCNNVEEKRTNKLNKILAEGNLNILTTRSEKQVVKKHSSQEIYSDQIDNRQKSIKDGRLLLDKETKQNSKKIDYHPSLNEQNNINYIPNSHIQQEQHNQHQQQQNDCDNLNLYSHINIKQQQLNAQQNNLEPVYIDNNNYIDVKYQKFCNEFKTNNEVQKLALSEISEIKSQKMIFQQTNQSPKLRILPTPKAIQPGQNSIINTTQVQQDILQTNRSNFGETLESNITQNEALSPQTREKNRLIRKIKLSFEKLNEPLKTTAEFYRIGRMLGKGAFGRVNLAIHKLTDQLVAVKSINKQIISEDEDSKKKVMQEVLILQKTKHPNIVKLFDSLETNKHIVFVMELCAGGDLLNYVRKRRRLNEDIAKYVFKQILEALQFCHSKGIVHRDIKLDNVLFDDEGIVKICDFGVSKHLSNPNTEIMTEQCGTPAYIAPEILRDKGYKGFGVDIWSLGVCLYAMLYGTVPFKANNMTDLHQLILKAKYSLKNDKVEISEEAKQLIRALLEPDVSKRPTISKIKKCKWLEDTYQDGAFKDLEIFNEAEKQSIKKDFTFQDIARLNRNKDPLQENEELKLQQEIQLTENLFTEHCLDSTQNVLLKNNTTKSVVLAPFNSTRTHLDSGEVDEDGNAMFPPLDIDSDLIMEKKIIKYAPRVKDIDRQYVMNNNGEVDNGVYNKFVKQSTENAAITSQSHYRVQTSFNDGQRQNDNMLSQDNSLVTSMNNQNELQSSFQDVMRKDQKNDCVTSNKDNTPNLQIMFGDPVNYKVKEIDTNSVNFLGQNDISELSKINNYVQLQQNKLLTQIEEEEQDMEYIEPLPEIVQLVYEFGYPRQFILNSLEKNEMNDSTTSYYLLEKYHAKYKELLLGD